MTEQELTLLLIEPEPIARIGLDTIVRRKTAWDIWPPVANLEAAQNLLRQHVQPLQMPLICLVIWDQQFSTPTLNPYTLKRFKVQFQVRYPELKIWLHLRAGRDGLPPMELGNWLPQPSWLEGCSWQPLEPDLLIANVLSLSRGERLLAGLPKVGGAELSAAYQQLSGWQRQCWSGIQRVDQTLQGLNNQLICYQDSWLAQQILAGQRRELKVVRWLLQQGLRQTPLDPNQTEVLTASPTASASTTSPKTTNAQKVIRSDLPAADSGSATLGFSSPSLINPSIEASVAAQLSDAELQPWLVDRIAQKLAMPLANLTRLPFEIDILNSAKKQELLAVLLRCYDEVLSDLRAAQMTEVQVAEQRDEILQDLWSRGLDQYFGHYTRLVVQQNVVDVIPTLLADWPLVQRSILTQLPPVEALLQAQLFGTPLVIDGVDQEPNSEVGLERQQQLLENLLIQLANAVLQPFLNHFADLDVIKQSFYDQRLLSTREIERFRNNLSWKYRFSHTFRTAQDVYESRHRLYILDPAGIREQSIYAVRRQELESLPGFQQTITLSLEFRDAIAPRLQALTSWVGSGVVYVLTKVIGRGIGLVGRGILQSVNQSWQELRQESNLKRKPER